VQSLEALKTVNPSPSLSHIFFLMGQKTAPKRPLSTSGTSCNHYISTCYVRYILNFLYSERYFFLVKYSRVRTHKPTIGECLLIMTKQSSDRKTQMSAQSPKPTWITTAQCVCSIPIRCQGITVSSPYSDKTSYRS